MQSCKKGDSSVEPIIHREYSAVSNKKLASSYTLSNWMGAINDQSKLSQITIPGTHESCARFESFPGTAKCQNLTLPEQFNAGVRFVDIRCRHFENTFTIHHGSVYQNLNFNDVINSCVNFLNANPSECIVMSVKEEHTAAGNSRSFEQTFESYIQQNPGKWYLSSNTPSLGQIRGKIVLLRRFGASNLPKGIDASVWPDQATFTTNNGNLKVQDNYVVSNNNTKWNQIIANFNEAISSSSDILFINFISGYKPGIFSIPSITTVSNDVNSRLTNYFNTNTSGRFGIVLLDFINADKSSQILNTNFFFDGSYKITSMHNNLSLDVTDHSPEAGTPIIQWPYHGGDNQRWLFASQGGNYYKITSQLSGKALEVIDHSTSNGASIIQWHWHGANNQIWQVISNNDGTHRIINKNSGLALDVPGHSTSEGTNLCQWAWAGGNNQKWIIN